MQKQIRNRVQLYGVAAIILALILGTLCYNFGVYPQIALPSQTSAALFKTFSSYEELKSFLLANSKTQGAFQIRGPLDNSVLNPETFGFDDKSQGSTPSYSATNIQVSGVDEADMMKTDGQYIYVLSGQNVSILRAYPPEQAEVLSRIPFEDMYPVGIFVSGDRLAVLGGKYAYPETFPFILPFAPTYRPPWVVDVKTFVKVYDISDRVHPVPLKDYKITGSYFGSRMIGDYVYFIASQPAYVYSDAVGLPMIYSPDGQKEISATEIHYTNVSDNYFQFTTFVALNMRNTTETPTYMTLMLGGTSGMYVSLSNIYVTFQEWEGNTTIYRLHTADSNITCEANGTVLGHELNQFSMDEDNGYFRIATTTWMNGINRNNLYILDMNLSVVGKLEDIAPGETLDSTRFIGNRCYLSTSIVRRDPFFVINVENATNPKILGYLKIPGFTRYLHPYDEDHVIGIGKDGSNLKVSLFDVSNVSDPKNISEYKVEGSWSDSSVLSEHKAFLFEKSKDLLAIPVSVNNWSPEHYVIWQGTYVFNVTLSDGLVLRGSITHQNASTSSWDSSYWVERSLYIENVLYTISSKEIKMNSLGDLTLINELKLP